MWVGAREESTLDLPTGDVLLGIQLDDRIAAEREALRLHVAGVEVRFPLLNDDLVAFSARLPPDLKLRGTRLRYFFKQALRGFLPHEIITKTKHGFGLPFGLWLQRSSRLSELINGNFAALRSRRIVRPEFLDRLLQLHGQHDARYYGALIWTLAMLEQWFREHRIGPV